MHVGKLDEVVQCFPLTVQITPTRDSTSELLDALRQREFAILVPAPRVKPERQTKKMEHRSGTFFGTMRILHCGSALRIVLGDASRIVEQQKQQHSSSSTAAVVAATSLLRTKMTSVDTPVSLLFSFLRFRAI